MQLSPILGARMHRHRARSRWWARSPCRRHAFLAVAVLLAVLSSGAVLAEPAHAYRIGPGVTWKSQASGSTQTLEALDMLNASTGWIVGRGGTIIHTSNGGAGWEKQPSGVSVDLYDIHFLTDQAGWAVGEDATVLRTTDGGDTWVECGPEDAHDNLHGVHFVSERTGWAVGWFGHVYSTTNGGDTWSMVKLGVDMLDFFLNGVHFVDERTGWIVVKLGYIFGTTDGGKSWSVQRDADRNASGFFTGPPLLRLAFADAQHGWAVGGFGGMWSEERIFHTNDGGTTWTAQLDGAGTCLGDIACVDPDTAWVVDWFDNVLYTVDGGEHWETQPLKGDFNAVDFVDRTTGWAVGNSGLIVKAVPDDQVSPTFADTSGSPFMIAIENLANAGVVSGYENGHFGPADPLYRAQFAKMICLALKLPVSEDMTSPFTDLEEDFPASLYPNDFVAAAYALGIVNGKRPGIFAPWDNVTGAQVISMVVRALRSWEPGRLAVPPGDFRGLVPASDPTHGANLRVAEYNHLLDGIVGPGAGWDPWAPMTRGEIAQVLWNGRLLE